MTSLPSPGSQRKLSDPEPEIGLVGAAVGVDAVVAGTAQERLVAVASEDDVGARATVERCGLVGERAVDLVDPDQVGAVAGKHDDLTEGGRGRTRTRQVPSSPTSIWIAFGTPAFSRSEIASVLVVPVTLSVPLATVAWTAAGVQAALSAASQATARHTTPPPRSV